MACNFFSELCLFCIFYLTCCCCANTKCAATPEQYLHTHTHTHVVLMRKEHFANSNSTNWVRVSLGISLLLFNIPILSSSEYLLSDYFLVASSMDFIVKPTKENDQKKKMKKDREKERERERQSEHWTGHRILMGRIGVKTFGCTDGIRVIHYIIINMPVQCSLL